MKLQDIEIEKGVVFKVQKGISFLQQNALTGIVEDYVDFEKMKARDKELELENIREVLQDGKSAVEFSTALSVYCLKTFVHEPKITEEMLNDPDDPNAQNYAVLGIKLTEISLRHIAQQRLLKKTQIS